MPSMYSSAIKERRSAIPVNPIVILWPLFFCSVKNAFLWEILKFICFSVFFIHNYTLILRN